MVDGSNFFLVIMCNGADLFLCSNVEKKNRSIVLPVRPDQKRQAGEGGEDENANFFDETRLV